jgi:hypothetical protein
MYGCMFCQEGFKTKWGLKVHVYLKHKPEDKRTRGLWKKGKP